MNDLPSIARIKKALFGIWILCLVCFIPPVSSIAASALGRNMAGLMIVVHSIECLVFLGTLRASGNPLPNEIAQTMLYGVVHYRQLKLAEEGSGTP